MAHRRRRADLQGRARTARSTGTPSPATAATTRTATSATARTARARAMPRRSPRSAVDARLLRVRRHRGERQAANGNSVMPSFGTNLNVMCYLDDIYVYLKAVGAEAIPRGRPPERADKPASYRRGRECLHGASRASAAAVAAAVALRSRRRPAGAADRSRVAAPRSGSAPTPPTCRSRTRPARASRTGSLSSSRPNFGRELEYTWYPMSTGFVRRTLLENRCDVIIGYAQGDELVLNTNHYYTSTHVLVAPMPTATSPTSPRWPTRGSAAGGSASSPAARRRATWRAMASWPPSRATI